MTPRMIPLSISPRRLVPGGIAGFGSKIDWMRSDGGGWEDGGVPQATTADASAVATSAEAAGISATLHPRRDLFGCRPEAGSRGVVLRHRPGVGGVAVAEVDAGDVRDGGVGREIALGRGALRRGL